MEFRAEIQKYQVLVDCPVEVWSTAEVRCMQESALTWGVSVTFFIDISWYPALWPKREGSMSPESSVGWFFPTTFSPGTNTLEVQRRIYRHSYGMAWLCQSYCSYGHSYIHQVPVPSISSSACTLSLVQYRLSGKALGKSMCRKFSSTLFLRNNFCSFCSLLEEKFYCLPAGTGF